MERTNRTATIALPHPPYFTPHPLPTPRLQYHNTSRYCHLHGRMLQLTELIITIYNNRLQVILYYFYQVELSRIMSATDIWKETG